MSSNKTFLRHYTRSCLTAALCFSPLILAAVSCEDPILLCVDGQPCVVEKGKPVLLKEGTKLCGEVFAGMYNCLTASCDDYLPPAPEVCDGLDNDGNCSVDDGVFDVPASSPNNTCHKKACGRCSNAPLVCRNGRMVCDGNPLPEECNSVDDDCNCEVDDIPVVLSYSGPPSTAGLGPCRPRVEACVDGSMRVIDEVLPAEGEVCHDGIDNDCDGLIDEPEGPQEDRSILLVVDVSGSMANKVSTVAWTVCDFASRLSTGSWFAVVAVAYGPGDVDVRTDFVDATQACAVMQQATTLNGTGTEPQFDGIVIGADLSWPTQDRAVVVFTDEVVQPAVYAAFDVEDSCLDKGYGVYVVTETQFFYQWDTVLSVCGGAATDISPPPGTLDEVLVDWFLPECAR